MAGETGSFLGDTAFSPAKSARFSSEPGRQVWEFSSGTRSCSSASAYSQQVCGHDQPWVSQAGAPPTAAHTLPPSFNSHAGTPCSPGQLAQPGRRGHRPGVQGHLWTLHPLALFGDAQPSWHWALPGPRDQPLPLPHHGPGPASGFGPPALPGEAQGLAPGQWEVIPAHSPGTAALAPTPVSPEISSAKNTAVRPCHLHWVSLPHPALELTRREGHVS